MKNLIIFVFFNFIILQSLFAAGQSCDFEMKDFPSPAQKYLKSGARLMTYIDHPAGKHLKSIEYINDVVLMNGKVKSINGRYDQNMNLYDTFIETNTGRFERLTNFILSNHRCNIDSEMFKRENVLDDKPDHNTTVTYPAFADVNIKELKSNYKRCMNALEDAITPASSINQTIGVKNQTSIEKIYNELKATTR